MKKSVLLLFVCLALIPLVSRAQSTMRVEAPEVVASSEQFRISFVIEGDQKASDFQWEGSSDFRIVWGPQQGSSTSISIINGKHTKSVQYTYTYILEPVSTGTFSLPAASVVAGKNRISSGAFRISVVSDGQSASVNQQGSGSAAGSSGGVSSQGTRESSSAGTGDVPKDDLFMRLTLSKTSAVVGEPITAVLKLYQRANVTGFEDAKFPSFNGFWSQETDTPSNIEFKREALGDRIFNTAVLRRYVLIPQQSGALRIDPAELVCLVNVRMASRRPRSIFDSFFDDDYTTVRKRISTPAVTVNVRPLPAGAPASFKGGVGTFSISAKVGKDTLSAHEATSLVVTVSGKGNLSLAEAPDVSFPPDFEAYDIKTSDRLDKSSGSVSGRKVFEYPFIPRSAGEFVIEPVEYSYYDIPSGRYVTVKTEPITVSVAKGSVQEASPAAQGTPLPSAGRKAVKNLGEDIRYISTPMPSLAPSGNFLVRKAGYVLAYIMALAAAVAYWLFSRRRSAMMKDVARVKTRKATKMALGRLRQASIFLRQNLHGAFYEELHRALLGFAGDKLALDAEHLNRDDISAAMSAGGVSDADCREFISLLDECEYARYSPEGEASGMEGRYDRALNVISAIDSSMKSSRSPKASATLFTLVLLLSLPFASRAADTRADSLWNAGVTAYSEGRWTDAAAAFADIESQGLTSAKLLCNLGDAYFKGGEIAKAILYYERALRLDPSYGDAKFNLAFANSLTRDKIDSVPGSFVGALISKVCYKMSSDAWAMWAILLFAAFLLLGLLFLLSRSSSARKWGFFGGIASAALSLCCLGFSLRQAADYGRHDAAIVMAPVSSVKSSPTEGNAKDLFVLHEGAWLRVLDEVGPWTNIALRDGRQGWIKTSDVERI